LVKAGVSNVLKTHRESNHDASLLFSEYARGSTLLFEHVEHVIELDAALKHHLDGLALRKIKPTGSCAFA